MIYCCDFGRVIVEIRIDGIEAVILGFFLYGVLINFVNFICSAFTICGDRCFLYESAVIILALLINEVRGKFFKRSVQTVVYLPHFISAVVVVSILSALLSPSSGLINQLITAFGGTPIHFMAEPKYFKTIYVLSDIWQSAGYGSIVYMAALTGIDPSLYEAATVDGASKWDKLIHITLPGLLPTIIIMLILRMGSIFSVGYEKIMLMYNPATYETADVISTYVYRRAFESGDYSFSAAVGLFNSVINFTIIVLFNKFSKKISEVSLW